MTTTEHRADTWSRFDERAQQAHAEEVARGEHDDQCEHGSREHNGRTIRNYICNCSKRRREREGYTTPPGPVVHHSPSCPRCWADVDHDGDSWVCLPCRVAWDPNDQDDPGEFTDDHGDLGAVVTRAS